MFVNYQNELYVINYRFSAIFSLCHLQILTIKFDSWRLVNFISENVIIHFCYSTTKCDVTYKTKAESEQ